jgi:hypothetical protein
VVAQAHERSGDGGGYQECGEREEQRRGHRGHRDRITERGQEVQDHQMPAEAGLNPDVERRVQPSRPRGA